MSYTFRTKVFKYCDTTYTRIRCVEINKECLTKNMTVDDAMAMLLDFIQRNHDSRRVARSA